MLYQWVLVSCLLAPGWQHTGPSGQNPEAKTPHVQKMEKQFAFYPGGKLEISAAAPGDVRVVGWESASVRVEMEQVFFYVSADVAQALAGQYPVRVTNTPAVARISTTGTEHPGAVMEVNVLVYVPREKTDLKIRMTKGDLSLATLNGWIEATIEEGNVEVRNMAGFLSAQTNIGDLDAELAGPHWVGPGLTLKTKRGAGNLRLPADFSAVVQLETKNGRISCAYPDQTIDGETVPLKTITKKKAASMSAPINSGGALIQLMTSFGDIEFSTPTQK
jgi:DUF4097 and DUF4098 domain-containing protein YvlB